MGAPAAGDGGVGAGIRQEDTRGSSQTCWLDFWHITEPYCTRKVVICAIYFSVSLLSAGVPNDEPIVRQLQLRHGLVKALHVLLGQKQLLGKILLAALPDDWQVSDRPLVSEEGACDEDTNQNIRLLQAILQVATQPSPIKATFSREELNVSLNLNMKLNSTSI